MVETTVTGSPGTALRFSVVTWEGSRIWDFWVCLNMPDHLEHNCITAYCMLITKFSVWISYLAAYVCTLTAVCYRSYQYRTTWLISCGFFRCMTSTALQACPKFGSSAQEAMNSGDAWASYTRTWVDRRCDWMFGGRPVQTWRCKNWVNKHESMRLWWFSVPAMLVAGLIFMSWMHWGGILPANADPVQVLVLMYLEHVVVYLALSGFWSLKSEIKAWLFFEDGCAQITSGLQPQYYLLEKESRPEGKPHYAHASWCLWPYVRVVEDTVCTGCSGSVWSQWYSRGVTRKLKI